MKDVFGNYVIQKMLDQGNKSQVLRLFEIIKSNVLDLSKDQYGCRVVQRIFEDNILSENQQIQLLSLLQKDLMTLMFDNNGNHVVQKVITKMSKKHTQAIIDVLKAQRGVVKKLAQNINGCRIVQRILEKYHDD